MQADLVFCWTHIYHLRRMNKYVPDVSTRIQKVTSMRKGFLLSKVLFPVFGATLKRKNLLLAGVAQYVMGGKYIQYQEFSPIQPQAHPLPKGVSKSASIFYFQVRPKNRIISNSFFRSASE